MLNLVFSTGSDPVWPKGFGSDRVRIRKTEEEKTSVLIENRKRQDPTWAQKKLFACDYVPFRGVN